ncbi:malate dehydrogenase [Pseudomonas putida S11]|nr:malate dehydrogenase [Pseudomonas putida S11]
MEGKGVLFKRFAGIDVFDIEVESESPQAFIDTVRRISITFGGINLEDIKAPECFEIERTLIEQCDIPVFHDDQHGTAIVTAAGMINALEIAGKKLEDAKIVCLGAGAAAISCMKLLVSMGAKVENIYMIDRSGVIHAGRDDLNQYKAQFAHATDKRTLADALDGADVFVGLSGPNLLSAEGLKSMAANPIVFACSNPDPEISPELAHATRSDVIMATGRSDYPNQVNNVLGFPFIFRGALDVRAKRINEEMKIAAAIALKDLAKLPVPKEVCDAYGVQALEFGREYIIPKPLDARLITVVSDAVAKAAIESGVATLPYPKHYPLTSVDDVLQRLIAAWRHKKRPGSYEPGLFCLPGGVGAAFVGAGVPAKNPTRRLAPATPVFAGMPAPTGSVLPSRALRTDPSAPLHPPATGCLAPRQCPVRPPTAASPRP